MSIQVIITADNHIDPRVTKYGSRQYDRKRDFFNSFNSIKNFALENKPDLLLIAGDFFDSIRPTNKSRAEVMKIFKSLSDKGIQIFMIGGNHDTPKSLEEGNSPLNVYGRSGHVTFFGDTVNLTHKTIKIKNLEVTISGLSFDHILGYTDPFEDLKHEKYSDINILLTHYQLKEFGGNFPSEPFINPKTLPKNLHLVAAGHLHKSNSLEYGRIKIISPGSSERLSFREEKERKCFAFVEIDKTGVISEEFIETPARVMKTIDYNCSKAKDINKFIISKLKDEANSELIIRPRLTGNISVKQLATYQRPEVVQKCNNLFFFIEPDESLLEITGIGPMVALSKTTPLEELKRFFDERKEKTKNKEAKQLLTEAYELCIRKLEAEGGI